MVRNSEDLRDAYNEVLPSVVQFGLEFGQNEVFFVR